MLIYGFGINDSEERVRVSGRTCRYYERWNSMLTRCYSKKYHDRFPTYKDCYVCDEWQMFSNFKKWMMDQEIELGNLTELDLDKDLTVVGSKVYSPNTCSFISKKINYFTLDNRGKGSKLLLGVTKRNCCNRFQSQCKNPFSNKKEYLGLYKTEYEAHLAWCKRKLELAIDIYNSDLVATDIVKGNIISKYRSMYESALNRITTN